MQYGHDDSAIGGDGQIGYRPVGAVAAAERDFVALPDPQFLEIVP